MRLTRKQLRKMILETVLKEELEKGTMTYHGPKGFTKLEDGMIAVPLKKASILFLFYLVGIRLHEPKFEELGIDYEGNILINTQEIMKKMIPGVILELGPWDPEKFGGGVDTSEQHIPFKRADYDKLDQLVKHVKTLSDEIKEKYYYDKALRASIKKALPKGRVEITKFNPGSPEASNYYKALEIKG